MFQLDPAPWRWRLGPEAGAAMAVSIGAWTLAGLQSFGLVASLGAFATLYGGEWSRAERAVGLPLFGAGLIIASLVGVVCSTSAVSSAMGLVLIAVLSTAITLLLRVGPPGPLMFVLVSGVSGYVAGHARVTGGPLTPALIPVLVASGTFIAYVVILIPLLWSSIGSTAEAPRRMQMLFRIVGLSPEERAIGARVVVAASLAGVIGAQLGIQRVYWVVVPAVAILQKSHSSRTTSSRACHRILGTAMGLGVFVLVQRFLPPGWWVVALIAILQCMVEVVVARNYALALTFVTPIALVISTAASPTDAHVLMGERMIDTLLGAGVALAVLWLSELIPWKRR